MKLGYWPLKGRAFATRCLLHYAGIEFEDHKYDAETWFGKDKPALAESAKPFGGPSIPYLQDGDVTIFQSMAVLRYAGRKAGLAATDNKGMMLEDMFEGIIQEIMDKFGKARFGSKDPNQITKNISEMADNLPSQLAPINAALAERKFLTGDSPSWIDFHLLTIIEAYLFFRARSGTMLAMIESGGNEQTKNICRMLGDLFQNEKLATYYKSVRHDPFIPEWRLRIGYWPLKGRAFAPRSLLHYAGVQFVDIQYEAEEWFGRDKPMMAKMAQPLAIPSIPYVQDGDHTVFQSLAVLRYVGSKTGICAKTNEGKTKEDMLQGVLTDIFDKLIAARFASKDPEVLKKSLYEFSEKVFAPAIKPVDDLLKNSKFLTGEESSWIDFHLYALIEAVLFCRGANGQMKGAIAKGGHETTKNVMRMLKDLMENERLSQYYESRKDVPMLPPF